MDASPATMLRILLPRTPFILKTALAHLLYLSPTSSKWDLRTELTINVFRDMIGPRSKPLSITQQQRLTTKDPGIKGKVWVSKVTFDVPGEDDVRQMLFRVIEEMGDAEWDRCEARALEAEWTGYRATAKNDEPQPEGMDEKEKYDKLMSETTSKVTLLYFHGGAMFLLDPATYRHITARLAKDTGGRVFSVRYRLSPQNPFPAALLDALTAYLSLLYPPPGAPHTPVPASDIVFGGDSAGGTLCTALLQLLLHLHRSNPSPGSPPTVTWHGQRVELPLPAGLALTSPWLDITRSLPSIEALAKYDYLPPPSHTQGFRFPPCDAWPTNPPRAEIYCTASAMLHPLVSPVAARSWAGAPPVFFSLGEEMLRDEDAVLARRLHVQGAKVRWREFEAMPHCFGMMLDALPASKLHFDETAAFCRDAVEGKVARSEGEFVLAKTLVRREVNLETVTELTDDEVEEAMRKGRERIEKKHEESFVELRPML